ncbi:MAG TPA: hypothetical protein VGH15_15520 [Caulobacteraceae bacterium]|jgi:hypothetical protein
MTANLYAWEPSLGLDPRSADFGERVDSYCDPNNSHPPTPTIHRFVLALLAKYPEKDVPDATAVWADGPLIGDASGGFINVAIIWSRFEEARPVFLANAVRFGLDAYDPQEDRLYQPPNYGRGGPLAWIRGRAWSFAAVAIGSLALGGERRLSRRELVFGQRDGSPARDPTPLPTLDPRPSTGA